MPATQGLPERRGVDLPSGTLFSIWGGRLYAARTREAAPRWRGAPNGREEGLVGTGVFPGSAGNNGRSTL